MSTTKVTSKGQVTIPKHIRERLGIKTGDELEFVENERGVITVRRYREPGSIYKWLGYAKDAFPGMSSDEVMEELRGRRPNDPIE
jgi:AbrB family looped-hinge helix DNA binding protein